MGGSPTYNVPQWADRLMREQFDLAIAAGMAEQLHDQKPLSDVIKRPSRPAATLEDRFKFKASGLTATIVTVLAESDVTFYTVKLDNGEVMTVSEPDLLNSAVRVE